MNLKDFKLNKKEDFSFYLTDLIILVCKNLENFRGTIKELESYIEEENLLSNDSLIEEQLYLSYRDRINAISLNLYNAIGDQANFAISYQNYRKAIKKTTFNYLDFTDDEQGHLNSMTTSRDWVAHIPVSLLNSYKYKEHDVFEEDETNIIYYPRFKKYEASWLVELYLDSKKSLELFSSWFNIMKKEYKKLTNKNCKLKSFEIKIRKFDDIAVSELSLRIQKKEIKSIEEIDEFYNKMK